MAGPARPDLPTGTVTFLFSDLEGSTRLTQELGTAAFRDVLEQHNEILRSAFGTHGGVERGTQGDAFLVIFRDAPAAVAAAIAAQRGLLDGNWPAGVTVRVRMGIHTGEGTRGGDDYVGVDVNRAARVAAVAHGGQILLTESARVLAERSLSAGAELRDLGEHRLKDLAAPEHLYQVVVDGLPSAFPAPRTATARTVELPARLTAFVGREREFAELAGLLDRNRLLTLTGPGGTGKTSLSIELARRCADHFPDGVWFVPLEGVVDPAHVGSAIAAVLRTPDAGKATAERLAAYLGDRAILLVLDNFEHVLEAARLVSELIRATPTVRVVVTSRAPLHVSGEQEYPVAPLPGPHGASPELAAAADSVRLFIDRASHVDPGFAPSAADLGVIAEICEHLDNLPLGIELAAARVGLMAPTAIRDRLVDRLDLPGPQSRDLPERQRTLRGAIAWSYELLDDHARALLACLSAFAGGFRLEEAETVAGVAVPREEFLDALLRLTDQSLVEPAGNADRSRYRLLDTIRIFASERLAASGRADAVRRAHAMAIADLFEAAARHLPGRDQVVWIPRLEADHDNHRAAMRWAVDAGEVDLAMRLGSSAWRFWQIAGYVREGRAAMDRVLAMPDADRATPVRIRALEAAGGLHYWSAEPAAAAALYQQQIDLARELGDARGIADDVFNLAHASSINRDFEAARSLGQEAARRYRELGDVGAFERSRMIEAFVFLDSGRLQDATEILASVLARYRELGDDFYSALAAGVMAGASLALGRFAETIRWGTESLKGYRKLGDVASMTVGVGNSVVLAAAAGMPEVAVTLESAYEASCARFGVRPPNGVGMLPGQQLSVDNARALLAPDVAAQAAVRGAAMSLDEAVDFVFEILGAAQVSMTSTATGGRPPG